MRRILASLFGLMAGCDFQVPVDSIPLGEFSLPGDPTGSELEGLTINGGELSPSQMPLYGEQLNGIALTTLVLRVTDAGQADGADDFGFVQHIEAYISAEGMSRALVARVDNFDADTSLILVAQEGVNLLPYLQAGATVELVLDGTAPSSEITFSAEANMLVDLF